MSFKEKERFEVPEEELEKVSGGAQIRRATVPGLSAQLLIDADEESDDSNVTGKLGCPT